MTFRADVLGWKTNHYPGITTREGQITNWPVGAPFPQPDQATHDAWETEYLAVKPDLDAARDVDGLKALKALVIWLAPLVGKTPAQARSEIIAIYKNL